MTKIIETISSFKTLADHGLVCIAYKNKNGIPRYLVGTRDQSLIDHFCTANKVGKTQDTLLTTHSSKVKANQISLFDIRKCEFVTVELETFQGYSFHLGFSQEPPKKSLTEIEKINFNNALTQSDEQIGFICSIEDTDYNNVIQFIEKGVLKVVNVNDFGVTTDGERIVYNVSKLKAVDIVIVITKSHEPSFVILEDYMKESAPLQNKKAVLCFATAFFTVEDNGAETLDSVYLLKENPLLK